MARYARLRLVLDTATNASFANPRSHACEYEASYDEGAVAVDIEVAAGGTTFDLAFLTTLSAVIVENLGTVAGTTVTVVVSGLVGTTGLEVKVPIAGEGIPVVVCPGLSPSFGISLTASTGTIPCRVTVIGS